MGLLVAPVANGVGIFSGACGIGGVVLVCFVALSGTGCLLEMLVGAVRSCRKLARALNRPSPKLLA